ncbi:ribonuclease T2 [Peniophora sp. CONT]|nr:ribonuclease T2 [Peniophora sp. CONT]
MQRSMLTALVAVAAAAAKQSVFSAPSSGCSTDVPISCDESKGSCCIEYPGGLITQTQFWDTDVPNSPADSWTIHGLWPDNCNGGYQENCDKTREYKDITTLLTNAGLSDTLNYMNTYWISDDETNEEFWEHEWATHGTCYSTLKPACFSDYTTGDEAVAFFQTAVRVFQSLPTYQWLSDAGITPDADKTYTLTELSSALKQSAGVTPEFECSGKNINAIYWYFNLKGSLYDGDLVPIDAPESSVRGGNCAASGLKYPPKSSSAKTGKDANEL